MYSAETKNVNIKSTIPGFQRYERCANRTSNGLRIKKARLLERHTSQSILFFFPKWPETGFSPVSHLSPPVAVPHLPSPSPVAGEDLAVRPLHAGALPAVAGAREDHPVPAVHRAKAAHGRSRHCRRRTPSSRRTPPSPEPSGVASLKPLAGNPPEHPIFARRAGATPVPIATAVRGSSCRAPPVPPPLLLPTEHHRPLSCCPAVPMVAAPHRAVRRRRRPLEENTTTPSHAAACSTRAALRSLPMARHSPCRATVHDPPSRLARIAAPPSSPLPPCHSRPSPLLCSSIHAVCHHFHRTALRSVQSPMFVSSSS